MKYCIAIAVALTSCAEMGKLPEPSSTPTKAERVELKGDISDIFLAVKKSNCHKKEFSEIGIAPIEYLNLMAVGYAISICNMAREDIKVVSKAPQKGDLTGDALSHYYGLLDSGVQSIRKTYSILLTKGMEKSYGKWCHSNGPKTGMFEAIAEQLENIEVKECHKEIVSEEITCPSYSETRNVQCPIYAILSGAVFLRTKETHKYSPSCENMFEEVEKIVVQDITICEKL